MFPLPNTLQKLDFRRISRKPKIQRKRFWFSLSLAGCREMLLRTTPVEEYIFDGAGFITTRLVYIG
jgi:hypothetical protein